MIKRLTEIVNRLMGVREGETLTPPELILENFRVIKGQYAKPDKNYVEVQELTKYLQDHCQNTVCPLRIYRPTDEREKIIKYRGKGE